MPAFLNAVATVGAFGHELLRYRKESLAGLAALETKSFAGLAALESKSLAGLAALETKSLAGITEAQSQARDLAARIEFVRREILFEMKFAGSRGGDKPTSPPQSLKPCVLSADKVAAAHRTGLRLNLGCGHIQLEGYLNVDMRGLPGIDIVAEVGNLPVEPATVQEVYLSPSA